MGGKSRVKENRQEGPQGLEPRETPSSSALLKELKQGVPGGKSKKTRWLWLFKIQLYDSFVRQSRDFLY